MRVLERNVDERLTTTVEALQRHHERFRVDELERARGSLAGGMPEEGARGAGAPADQQVSARPDAGAQSRDRGRAPRLTLLLQHIYRPLAEQACRNGSFEPRAFVSDACADRHSASRPLSRRRSG
jgi:hypothetical protein